MTEIARLSDLNLEEHLARFRQSDEDRHTLTGAIIDKLRQLELKYDEKCNDLSNEIESRRMWQNKATTAERALAQQKQVSVSSYPQETDFDPADECDRDLIRLCFVYWMEMER